MLTHMAQEPEPVKQVYTDDIATGERRAYQFLRLLEQDRDETQAFLESVAPTRPEPLVAMGVSLKSLARSSNQKRAPEEQARLQARWDDLQPLFERGKKSKSAMYAWVRGHAEIARGEFVERLPDRQDRISHYETGAKLAFEGGDPDSPFRKLYGN